MFIRKRKSIYKNGKIDYHYQIVQTYRQGDKVISKVFCNLGYESTIDAAIKSYQTRLFWAQRGLFNALQKKYHSWVPHRCRASLSRRIEKCQVNIQKYHKLIEILEQLQCSGKVITPAKQS
jgi:hypothetical protein